MEPTSPSIELLYDFVYADTKRFSQYLAQLDPNGALTGIKLTASGSHHANFTGKATALVAAGSLGETVTDSEGVERQFDPLWTTPIAVMNRLDELGFIKRSLGEARIGQLFLLKGHMQILDIRMLKELWPTVLAEAKKQANAAIQNAKQTNRGYSRKADDDKEIKTLSEGLKHLPHSLQMHLLTSEAMLWATLIPEQMIVSAEDFLLKHGSAVPGEWYILGLVDSFAPVNAVPIWGSLPISDLAKAMMAAAEQIRVQFGRPANAVAVTPLSIFRAVRPNDDPA